MQPCWNFSAYTVPEKGHDGVVAAEANAVVGKNIHGMLMATFYT